LELGVSLATESEAAGEAFFALHSRRAQRALAELESRVTLEERKNVLHLVAEAIAATPVPIEAWDGAEGQRWVSQIESSLALSGERTAGTDGARIFLPPEIDRFDERRANASTYTVLTLRQIGLFLYGTLGLRLEDFAERPSESEETSVFRRLYSATAAPAAAAAVFSILEERRIAASLARDYPGFATSDAELCGAELADLDPAAGAAQTALVSLLELSLRAGAGQTLSAAPSVLPSGLQQQLRAATERVCEPTATVASSARRTLTLLREWPAYFVDQPFFATLPLEALEERRDEARASQELGNLLSAVEELGESQEDFLARFGVTAADPLGALSLQDGSLFSLSGLLQAEDDTELPWQPSENEPAEPREVEEFTEAREILERKGAKVVQALRRREAADTIYRYDEWDHEIDDYRPQWCALREICLEVPKSSTPEALFVQDTRRELAALGRRIRKQLEQLKPELYRRIPRLIDGDELDLDAAIEAVSDLRAGLSPSEKLYVRRNKQERDVAAVFLLDLSASTDEEVSDASEEPAATGAEVDFVDILAGAEPDFPSDRDPLWGNWPPAPVEAGEPKRRVIDVEREAVVLMADALGTLGDAYAIYGFSGYGREGVEFYIAKDFDDAWDDAAEGRLGAMRPRQSTRMGPAIRHALRKLDRQEAKVKALLMLSDGFPQDHDYGRDRNSHEHGIQDTMMALREAELRGIDTFCLTVDPAGHDYLRRMCPDQQYLVLEETVALARELPKVYRGITG
ncbi:MAG: hypothetical protein AAGK22_27875, partial [Acidobacteriota bacterium]